MNKYLLWLLLLVSPVSSFAAVAYVSNGGNGQASGTSATVTVPSGVVNGDLLVVVLNCKSASAATPAQTGWTNVLDFASSYPSHLALFYRYASSEPASYTMTCGTSTVYTMGTILRITGSVTSGNPFDVVGTGASIPSSVSATASAITTVTANTLVIQFAGVTDGSLTVTSYPSGFTGVNLSGIAFAYESFVGPGSIGPETITYSAAAGGATVLVAIKPAPSGGPPASQFFFN